MLVMCGRIVSFGASPLGAVVAFETFVAKTAVNEIGVPRTCNVIIVVKVDISMLVKLYASDIVRYDRTRSTWALQCTTQ